MIINVHKVYPSQYMTSPIRYVGAKQDNYVTSPVDSYGLHWDTLPYVVLVLAGRWRIGLLREIGHNPPCRGDEVWGY